MMKNKVLALLELGEKPKDIAEKTGVNYQTVLKHKKEMMLGKSKEDVQSLITEPALHMIVEKAKEEAPAKVVQKLEAVAEGLNGLQLLDAKFHTTLANALDKANEFLKRDDLKPSEWVAITNALSQAYNNVFKQAGVNVNVNNGTQFSDSKLSMFKGSLRE